MKTENDAGGNKPLSKIARDLDDLQNEIAGRETGRIKRFLPQGAGTASADKRGEREFRSALMTALQNSQYAALHSEAMDTLRDAETKAQAAITKALEAIQNAKTPEERDAAQAHHDALLQYQVDVLGHARERLTNEEKPASKDEIRDIQE